MQLRVQGVIRTDDPVLDVGITDMAVLVGANGVQLYTTTGRNGGLASFRIGSETSVTLASTTIYSASITRTVSDRFVLDSAGTSARLFVGTDDGGLIAYAIRSDLAVGGRSSLTLTTARQQAGTEAGRYTLEALVTMTPDNGTMLPWLARSNQIVELRSVTVSGNGYVLTADAASNSVASFRRDPATGALVEVDRYGAAEGLGIYAPTAMEVVRIGGTTYAVLASAGTSSLSVMRIEADGRLHPVDHVIDTGSTRIQGVQAMTVLQSGDHVFVIAGGADHGVSLFQMLPDGRLVWLDTVADTAALSMQNVSAITGVIHDGVLHVFVGSQIDSGVTHLTMRVDNQGVVRESGTTSGQSLSGTAGHDVLIARGVNATLDGGAGNDILVSGPGRTTMTGGAGRDIFVIRRDTTEAQIRDFRPGEDRLDLTDLPMLRDISQLGFRSTSDGARIDYRGTVIVIRSHDGQPLSREQVFPQYLTGPDRIPLSEREWPGEFLLPDPGRGGMDHLVDAPGAGGNPGRRNTDLALPVASGAANRGAAEADDHPAGGGLDDAGFAVAGAVNWPVQDGSGRLHDGDGSGYRDGYAGGSGPSRGGGEPGAIAGAPWPDPPGLDPGPWSPGSEGLALLLVQLDHL